ncbi:MAG: aldehyde dehydrogenase family protein, partial [Leptolyngbyaceae bacterium]|nr:aldehyde dehydrogenase family protein [Leptolyngbyaceae bacterium]
MKSLQNYIAGTWQSSATSDYLEVRNPATNEVLAEVPLSLADELDQAAIAAQTAFSDWRRVPPTQRVQYLFKL